MPDTTHLLSATGTSRSRGDAWFFLLLAATTLALHWVHMNQDLIGIHVWRQSQTQWNVRNFYRHDFNIFNPRDCSFNGGRSNIMRFEFPLMQWMAAALHKLFGESIAITRSFVFGIGLCTAWGMYRLFQLLLRDTWASRLGTWAFCFSPVFFYYTINPLPDNMALCGAVWFLLYQLRYARSNSMKDLVPAALFLLLATLCKLPYIILAAGFAVYVFRPFSMARLLRTAAVCLLVLSPAIAWYAWVIPTWGANGVLKGVLDNQIDRAETLRIAKYHLNTMFPRLLLNPFSTLLLATGTFFFLRNRAWKKLESAMLLAALAACFAYLFFEFNMISHIHDYYMMPFLPPLYLGVGYGIRELLRLRPALMKGALSVYVLALTACTWYDTRYSWSIEQSYMNPDIFIYQEELKNAVPREERCIILADISGFIYAYEMDKMGYIFNNDKVPVSVIDDIVRNNGVRYMYSDARAVDENPELAPYIDSVLLQRGSMKVIRLQVPEQ